MYRQNEEFSQISYSEVATVVAVHLETRCSFILQIPRLEMIARRPKTSHKMLVFIKRQPTARKTVPCNLQGATRYSKKLHRTVSHKAHRSTPNYHIKMAGEIIQKLFTRHGRHGFISTCVEGELVNATVKANLGRYLY